MKTRSRANHLSKRVLSRTSSRATRVGDVDEGDEEGKKKSESLNDCSRMKSANKSAFEATRERGELARDVYQAEELSDSSRTKSLCWIVGEVL